MRALSASYNGLSSCSSALVTGCSPTGRSSLTRSGPWSMSARLSKQVFISIFLTFLGHDLSNLHLDHAFPVMVLFIILSIFLAFIGIKFLVEAFLFNSSQTEELLGVEELLNFYKALYHNDLQMWMHEEMALRSRIVLNQNININLHLGIQENARPQSFSSQNRQYLILGFL